MSRTDGWVHLCCLDVKFHLLGGTFKGTGPWISLESRKSLKCFVLLISKCFYLFFLSESLPACLGQMVYSEGQKGQRSWELDGTFVVHQRTFFKFLFNYADVVWSWVMFKKLENLLSFLFSFIRIYKAWQWPCADSYSLLRTHLISATVSVRCGFVSVR